MVNISQIKSEFGNQVTPFTFHINDFDKNIRIAVQKAREHLIRTGGIVFFPKTDRLPPLYWIFKPIDNKMGDTIYTYASSPVFKTRPYIDTAFEEGDIIENTDSTQDFKLYEFHKGIWQRTHYLSVTPHQLATLEELPEPNQERVGSLVITKRGDYGTVLAFCIRTDRDTYEWTYLPLFQSYFASTKNFGTIKVKDSAMIKNGVLQNALPPVNAIYTQYMRENGVFYEDDNPNTLFPNTYWLDISSSVLSEAEKRIRRIYRRTK